MTTKHPVFHSQPGRYQLNIKHASTITAGPATLTGPNGQEPGVILREKHFIQGVYPLSDAMRIATEIADSIAYHKEQEANRG